MALTKSDSTSETLDGFWAAHSPDWSHGDLLELRNGQLKELADGKECVRAEALFVSMMREELVNGASCAIMLLLYARLHEVSKAVQLFQDTATAGFASCSHTFAALFTALRAPAGSADLVDWAAGELSRLCVVPSVQCYGAIVAAYGAHGNTDAACLWWQRMRGAKVLPSVIEYNILVDVLGKAGRFDEALATLGEMQQHRATRPDAYTFNSLLHSLAVANEAKRAVPLLQQAHAAGVSLLPATRAALRRAAQSEHCDVETSNLLRALLAPASALSLSFGVSAPAMALHARLRKHGEAGNIVGVTHTLAEMRTSAVVSAASPSCTAHSPLTRVVLCVLLRCPTSRAGATCCEL